jgi:hypothetical protein
VRPFDDWGLFVQVDRCRAGIWSPSPTANRFPGRDTANPTTVETSRV